MDLSPPDFFLWKIYGGVFTDFDMRRRRIFFFFMGEFSENSRIFYKSLRNFPDLGNFKREFGIFR